MKRLVSACSLLTLLVVATSCFDSGSGEVYDDSSTAAMDILESMKIGVSAEENRAVSYTNKEAAYYYTQTHVNAHHEWKWFEGLNVAKRRMFAGYGLILGGQPIDNRKAEVDVYPHKLVRKHPSGIIEELWMADGKNLIVVKLEGVKGKVGIRLKGEGVDVIDRESFIIHFSSMEAGKVVSVGALKQAEVALEGAGVVSTGESGGFIVAVGDNATEAAQAIAECKSNFDLYSQERTNRIRFLLLEQTFLDSDDKTLELAHNWLVTTTDQLVTKQQGYGIYAGLPWFNEYWGRDQFIAMPGACLVTGDFDVARRILLSFAEYQDTDPASKYFGRVPNYLNPENANYHTTDGTPRFVIELQEYVQYSGDTSIIRELYPNVRYSIEGALKNWTDEKGYLIHADNETWMDAREPLGDGQFRAYSPRDNRANDIQALWHQQLMAGAYFATFMQDGDNAKKWRSLADKVAGNFAKDYRDGVREYLADRLKPSGEADFTLRPNQLFSLDLIDDEAFRRQATRTCWEKLTFPWGVASLTMEDENFHPYHHHPAYHKDAAYHNGTVWLWNNGIMMQRMIEAGQQDEAYKLFENMNRQLLDSGCVGGMAENMNAYPSPGKNWPRLTGTYLQAWSNAEQLRVWYQWFLGIRPDKVNEQLTLAPRIPEKLKRLEYEFKIGEGYVLAKYEKGVDDTGAAYHEYSYHFHGTLAIVTFDLSPYESVVEPIGDTQILVARAVEGKPLQITVTDGDGTPLREAVNVPISETRQQKANERAKAFEGVQFAQPMDATKHKVLLQ